EQRLISVGLSNRGRLLTVVWVERGDVARIITAFEPSHHQKRRYSNAK
ncbi:BrnT family toxin, partial [Acinetobacter ursingii]